MQPQLGFCDYFGFIFVSYCAVPLTTEVHVQKRTTSSDFSVDYQWSYINFTWPSQEDYQQALYLKRYIPENIAIAGIKIYKDQIYFALPRIRNGTPVTLAHASAKERYKTDLLLTPFPSWSMNVQNNCATLQSVQSMEIDRRGIMWVLDGMRTNDMTSCPPKLVLLDLNHAGRVVQVHTFRNEICLRKGGFLNDLVIDESDGGYAYITDNGNIDPGLIVYSKRQGRAWKLRDRSMFAEIEASNFTVDGLAVTNLSPIDGIALSPLPKNSNHERLVYFTSLTGFSMFAISTKVLQNEAFSRTDSWRRYVKYIGKKASQSDGMIIDSEGTMYYGLLSSYGLAKWNINQPFSTAKRYQFNPKEFIWPDSFTMDSEGFLYVITNGIHKFFDPNFPLSLTNEIKFRIVRTYTGNRNYLFPGQDLENNQLQSTL